VIVGKKAKCQRKSQEYVLERARHAALTRKNLEREDFSKPERTGDFAGVERSKGGKGDASQSPKSYRKGGGATG